ncbi:MAG TPA: hypothetical protein VLU94_00595 [Candidatus Nitrosotalea sp.]|nr:hypothetical protein [Candidatus Nitrosotalea sp.]
MNSEQAKETLLLFRPNSSDSSDPEFAEALGRLKDDAELRRWFEDHCARQAVIRDRLRQIPVPSDLQQTIVEEITRRRTIVFWRRPFVQGLAAAAAILLVATISHFWPRPNRSGTFTALQNQMVRRVQRGYVMDMWTNNVAEIRQYLASNHAHTNYFVPVSLGKLPAEGCAVFSWHKKPVSLVCYKLGIGSDLYFFIVNRTDVLDPPQSDQPQFTQIGRFVSASWSRGDKTYILAGRGDEALIRSYLE